LKAPRAVHCIELQSFHGLSITASRLLKGRFSELAARTLSKRGGSTACNDKEFTELQLEVISVFRALESFRYGGCIRVALSPSAGI